MRILYCLNSLDVIGGIERVTINKCNYLTENGHDVAICVTDHRDNVQFIQPLSPKVKFFDINVGHWFGERKWHSFFSKPILHYIRLHRIVKDFNPDVIISCGQSEKQVIALLRTKAIKIREIHFLSTYRSYTYNKKWLIRLLDWLDYKIYILGYRKYVLLTHEDFNDYYIGNKQKTTVIHNPLTVTPQLSELKNNIVQCVCRINDQQKGLSELIEIFRDVVKKHPNWVLQIYGKGPDENKLNKQIEKYQLQSNIILAGYTDNVPSVLSNASIYVCTSRFEGFGLSLLEAMACGLPVVTYQFPTGAKDILENSDA